MAKRLFQDNQSPFNLFQVQALMDEAAGDEDEIPLIRYNLNGIELNEEGFQKLGKEIALAPMSGNFPMPWGKERVQLYFGEMPLGGSLEPIIIRKGIFAAAPARGEDRRSRNQGVLRSVHRYASAGACPQEIPAVAFQKLTASSSFPPPQGAQPIFPALIAPCFGAAIIAPGGERGPVTFVAFKAIDPVLCGQGGGFDSHTLPPKSR